MTLDRRSLFATDAVAHVSLRGLVERPAYVHAQPKRVDQPVTDLCDRPRGQRDRQVLWGETVSVLVEDGAWSFVQSTKDGYVGWVETRALGDPSPATHRVSALATHLYPAPDFKQRALMWLSHGSQVHIAHDKGTWAETSTGHFLPNPHLRPLTEFESDWVSVAELYLGTPYLWGGNSSAGLDCSGLVQAALLAGGLDCPGDSDQQANTFETVDPKDPHFRGDLHFWQGHVAIATDATMLIHANAHAMATTYEPRETAMARIPDRYLGRRRVGA